ncbi:hypothetical protein FQA39_LY12489 [Lamprigera yunnana]|nr:hypothetical protein FQA39_LY12489 [Lamprigera yunnana]
MRLTFISDSDCEPYGVSLAMNSLVPEDSVTNLTKLVSNLTVQPVTTHPLLNNNETEDCETAEEAATTDSDEYLSEPLKYTNLDYTTSSNSTMTLTPHYLHTPENDVFVSCLNGVAFDNFEIPIVGYEVMEERARFTVFKLRIDNKITGDFWYVFRRYTDFVRLCSKIKHSYPHIVQHLPRKRWLGNNFDPIFLEERVNGLQTLVNAILSEADLKTSQQIQDFFCFNEPPTVSENTQQSRAMLETFEDTVYQLRKQLKEKENEVDHLHDLLHSKITENENLKKIIKNSTLNCQKCYKEYENISKSLHFIPETSFDEQSINSPMSSTKKSITMLERAGLKTEVELKREMGLFSAINMILGVMIGSGIFVSTSSALEHSGSVAMCIIVWTVCGIISLLGALTFAELGTVVPRSGAEYAFYMDSFGPLHTFWGKLPAFLCSWVYVIALRPAEVAVITLTFSAYTCQPLFEFLGICDVNHQTTTKKLIAVIVLGIITYINVRSVKLFVKIQNIFSSFKVVACLIVILGGIYELCRGNFINLQKGFEGTKYSPKDMALAFYSGLWAYDGWNAVTTVTEEVKKPEINILRSIVISVPLVTLLYVFMNISYMTVLTVEEMTSATAVAVLFGEKVLGPVQFLIPMGVACATFGCALSIQFSVTRICFVASQDGHLIESLSYIHHQHLTPVPAVVMQGVLSLLYIIIGNIEELIQFASFLIWVGYGTAMVSLLILRRTMKDVHRPYRVPTWIVIFIMLVAIFLAIIPMITDPSPKYLFAIGFMVIGAIVYYWFVYRKNRPRIMDKVTYLLQVLFEIVPVNTHED